ncbi:MAG TPA: helix-turn-helix domain-containing protein [Clostridia bacterium]|nr:helix-turn-helix domain-containing protein [Clostridia bacterium]
MRIIRIGNKLISTEKVSGIIEDIFRLRVKGYSQQEVAQRLHIDRPFISRLERLGEIRKGRRIAVVGFPIENKEELEKMLVEEGVEYTLLLTDKERWEFVEGTSGVDLLNSIMNIITNLRTCDIVVTIGSNYRIKLCQALLDKEVIGVEIGKSPIEGDRYVSVDEIREIIKYIME